MKPQKAAHGVSRGRELGLGQARREAKEIEQTNLSSPVPPIAMDFAENDYIQDLQRFPPPSPQNHGISHLASTHKLSRSGSKAEAVQRARATTGLTPVFSGLCPHSIGRGRGVAPHHAKNPRLACALSTTVRTFLGVGRRESSSTVPHLMHRY